MLRFKLFSLYRLLIIAFLVMVQMNLNAQDDCSISALKKQIIDTDVYSEVKKEAIEKLYDCSRNLPNDTTQINVLLFLASQSEKNDFFIETIKYCTKGLLLVDQNKCASEYIELHSIIANVFTKMGIYEEALSHREKEISLLENQPKTNFIKEHIYNASRAIGLIKMNAYNDKSAYSYLSKSYNIALELKNKYLKVQSLDDFVAYYYLIENDIPKVNNEAIKAISLIEDETSDKFIKLKSLLYKHTVPTGANDKKAKEWMFKALELSKNEKNYKSLCQLYFITGLKLNALNEPALALMYLDSSEQIYNKYNHTFKFNNPIQNESILPHTYIQKAKAYASLGMTDSAKMVLQQTTLLLENFSSGQLSEKVFGLNSNYMLEQINLELEAERYEKQIKDEELLKLKTKQQMQWYRNVLIILCSLFIIAITWFVYYKKRKQHQQQQEIKEYQNHILELENKHQEEVITNSLFRLDRKDDFFKEILDKINTLKGEENREIIQKLKLLIRNEIDIDESHSDIENYMKEVGTDFIVKLNEIHPGLTNNEIELAVLLRMNIDTHQIAIIRNVEKDSVKKARTRLRNKLNLTPDIDTYEYLKNINTNN